MLCFHFVTIFYSCVCREELAVKAKAGDNDALLQLWEQNDGLAHIFAARRYKRLVAQDNMHGADYDDLMQAVFLALVDAVGYYDPEKEHSFSNYWGTCVKTEFNSLLGTRSQKRDPIDFSVSLDTPLTDETDPDLLVDIIPDPSDDYEKKDHEIWCAELHEAVEKVLAEHVPDQEKVLRLRFYDGLNIKETAEQTGLPYSVCRQVCAAALRELRKPKLRRALEGFVDLNTDFYASISAKRQESPVEMLVLRRERMRGQFAHDFKEA